MAKEVSFYRYHKVSERSGEKNPAVIITEHRHPDHRLHAHDFLEIVTVSRGDGIHLLEDGEYPLAAGDIFIIPRGVRHGYRNVRNFHIINMLFKLSTVERHFPEIVTLPGFLHFFRADRGNAGTPKPGRLLNLDSADLAALEKLQLSIIREQEKRMPGYRSMCLACLAELLIFLCRRLAERSPQLPLPPHREFAEVSFHINAGFHERLRVEELAALAGMSVRSFQRHFTRVYGLSPMGYVRKVRLEKARDLLRRSDRGVARIAAECGFPGASVLSTEFRKQFGVTPREFRKTVT